MCSTQAKEHVALLHGVLHRAGFNGQRILGRCFPAVAERRPSAAGVSRSHDYDTQPRSSLHTFGSKSLVCSRLSIPERTRDFDQQEDGVEGEGTKAKQDPVLLPRKIHPRLHVGRRGFPRSWRRTRRPRTNELSCMMRRLLVGP